MEEIIVGQWMWLYWNLNILLVSEFTDRTHNWENIFCKYDKQSVFTLPTKRIHIHKFILYLFKKCIEV